MGESFTDLWDINAAHCRPSDHCSTMKLLSVLLLMVPLWTSCSGDFLPSDCLDIQNQNRSKPSGVYTIYPFGVPSGVQVYCDMESQGGGWTVFQRRMDGSLNFYRPWAHYRTGFGSAAGEYWLGLENLFLLIVRKRYELLVDMEDFSANKTFARYSAFSIESEFHGYRLHVSGFINGGAGDGMNLHNGQKFSTFDKDQDSSTDNCARRYRGAFWYENCHTANPNSVYLWGEDGTVPGVGVTWTTWRGDTYSLKTISMKIRPVQ